MRSSHLARLWTPGLVAVLTAACAMHPVPRSRLTEGRRLAYADLTLMDGTQLGLERPQFEEGWVRGRIETCAGSSCAQAREDRGVKFDTIETVRVESANGALIMLGIIGGVAVVTALVLSADASSSSSSSRTTTTSSSGSDGGILGDGDMSCPRAYSWDGQHFRLDSGTFGGSMVAANQLTDHDVLEHLVAVDGQYKLRLKNELPETEHTDALSLRVVDHAVGAQVVPTVEGKLLTFRDPSRPLRATDLRGRDVLADVIARDGVEFRSDVTGRRPDVPADLRDGLLLSFPRPPGAKHAKVWLTARNSPWSSSMLDYFFAHLGPAYPGLFDRMEVDPSARQAFDDFLARDGMLHVRAGKTEKLVPLIGPELLKDVGLELPVEGDGPTFALRLDATTAFWMIDSVAVSFDADEPLKVHDVSPRAALTHDGRDVLAKLAHVDGDRFVTERGDWAEVTFDAPPKASGARTVLLVSTGWYRPHVTPARDADPAAMVQVMNTPGAAAARSLSLLEAATAQLLLQ